MSTPDKGLESFFTAVVDIVAEKDRSCFHYPNDECFVGECDYCRTRFDWRALRILVREFWEGKSEVNKDWRSRARRAGFEFKCSALHDIMLGIFIGGDRPERAASRPRLIKARVREQMRKKHPNMKL